MTELCGHEWVAPVIMPDGRRPRWIWAFFGDGAPPVQRCELPADHPIDEPHRDGKIIARNTGQVSRRRAPVGLYRP